MGRQGKQKEKILYYDVGGLKTELMLLLTLFNWMILKNVLSQEITDIDVLITKKKVVVAMDRNGRAQKLILLVKRGHSCVRPYQKLLRRTISVYKTYRSSTTVSSYSQALCGQTSALRHKVYSHTRITLRTKRVLG